MRLVTISVLLFILVAAIGAGYGLALLTGSIQTSWPLLSDPPPPAAGTTQQRASSVNFPTETRAPPTLAAALPVRISTATPEPTYTPRPVPTPVATLIPTPTPAPIPIPIPTPTPPPISAARLPWVADGIDESERPAFRELSTLIEQNPAVAKMILGHPWVADGVNGSERTAIERIGDIGYDLPTTANPQSIEKTRPRWVEWYERQQQVRVRLLFP